MHVGECLCFYLYKCISAWNIFEKNKASKIGIQVTPFHRLEFWQFQASVYWQRTVDHDTDVHLCSQNDDYRPLNIN